MARSEEDILAGVLRVRVGTAEKALPTLKLKAAREWKAKVAATLSTRLDGFDVKGVADVANLANLASNEMLDLVLAYDRSGALGGKEYLEENADDAQVYAILRLCLEVSFPFVRDLGGIVGVLRSLGAMPGALPPGEKSTNGHLPTGDLIPTPSESV